MQNRSVEITVGLFVALGLAALFVLAMKVSSISGFSGNNGYQVHAYFDSIGGLKVKAPVAIAGVRVGRVQKITLSNADYRAKVTIGLDADLLPMQKINAEGEGVYGEDGLPTPCLLGEENCATPFYDDASASILTAGLLGEQYIGLNTGGGAPVLLENNGLISITQSAIGLEQIIGQVLFSGGDNKDNGTKSEDKKSGLGTKVETKTEEKGLFAE